MSFPQISKKFIHIGISLYRRVSCNPFRFQHGSNRFFVRLVKGNLKGNAAFTQGLTNENIKSRGQIHPELAKQRIGLCFDIGIHTDTNIGGTGHKIISFPATNIVYAFCTRKSIHCTKNLQLYTEVKSISDNWVIRNLESAIATWNDKLAELWTLITQTPETFKGGQIWSVITNINSALVGIDYGLLVLFFAVGIFSSAASFKELQRPEFALRHFIRFVLAKVAVGRGMELMTAIFSICGSVVSASMSSIGGSVTTTAELPAEIVSAIEDVGFLQSIPLWLVSFLGSLFITVLSFILILTVYGRFFKLYIYTAISPLPLASFAGENTAGMGKAFVKSYIGVCLEGAVIVLACLIYSAFLSSGSPVVDSSLPAVTMAWEYIGELVFNMLVLTGLVKGADRIVREMFSL